MENLGSYDLAWIISEVILEACDLKISDLHFVR